MPMFFWQSLSKQRLFQNVTSQGIVDGLTVM